MENQFAIKVSTGFGLAFDVEKDESRVSGFRPAQVDLGVGMDLFGNERLEGFAAALRIGFLQHLVLAGGDEGRYKADATPVNRAEVIRLMLINDCGIAAERVTAIPSRSNTGGNIAIFKTVMEERGLEAAECGLMTNLYHGPRAMLMASELGIRFFPAESLWLLEDKDRKNQLIQQLGDGGLAERYAEEAAGVADMIRGTYVPRTDTEAVQLPGVHIKN